MTQTFTTKKAGDVQIGDRFFSADGKHSLIYKIEKLNNSHYVNITYKDRWHNSITHPYEINQEVLVAEGVVE